jgi:anti-sigma B factor antagonist
MTIKEGLGRQQFQVAVWQRDRQRVTVVLTGELDLFTAPELEECLSQLVRCGVIHFEIDLANLDFIASTGLNLLLAERKRAQASGGSLIVRNASERAWKVFEISGLVEPLSVTRSPDGAPVLGN